MTGTFCDVCGKEIQNRTPGSVKIKYKGRVDVRRVFREFECHEKMDVCKECFELIVDEVKDYHKAMKEIRNEQHDT